MAYSEKVVDHFTNPKNVGSLDKNDVNVGTGLVGAPECGDVMKLQIKVDDNQNIIDAKFKTFGCIGSNSPIATPNGFKNISTLSVGEEIWAWNGKEVVKNTISKIKTKEVDYRDLLRIVFEKGRQPIICSKDHIWWGSDNKPIEAIDLEAGKELLEITENEIRSLNNVRQQQWLKDKNSVNISERNKLGLMKQNTLPQNQKGYKHTDEAKLNHSIASKKEWKNPEYRKNWERGMQGAAQNRPTKLEIEYINLFEKHKLDVRYIGDGSFWCGSSHLNPDFKVNGQKKVIEVYTSKLPKFMMDRSDENWIVERKEKLENAGFKSLFLDIKNIENSIPEVTKFIHNGFKIKKISPIEDKRQLRGQERNGDLVKLYDLSLKEGANIFFVHRAMSHNCGSAIAASSLATEWVKDRHVDAAMEVNNTEIVEELSLPPVKIHCSVLAEDAIKAAIADYKQKQEGIGP